ncbi:MULTISPECIES: O-methyltransferase [Lysinibacillus]|uniref:tRNA 5-hydroxyuridine methyltransferase n=1 Tax=Lysinibacillus antri TaxID=2498145 RepID=A0A3S0WIV9_9BACI|nr:MULTISPECIES: O-methyltransferase [Lysinibacillus]RUL57087.1 O-methyltransferase [Lysinibacillus antri]TSI03279.1 O-methyltransferase [Lysinibacillus sp. BW-2-10]
MEFSDVYIESLVQPRDELLMEMETYAKENHVPIMQLPAIDALNQLLRIQKPSSILEIGTAIGYSALRMSLALPNCKIVTIERDLERVEMAKHFLSRSQAGNRITVIEGDALEVDVEKIQSTFDAIFIDAAKGQYQRFFEKYSPLVPSGGILYIDNMYMHGLSDLDIKEVPRRKRTMIRNLKNFTDWIMNHPDYDSTFFPIGDGLLICLKR